MSALMKKILADKLKARKRLAALPFGRKLTLMEKMRDRSLSIASFASESADYEIAARLAGEARRSGKGKPSLADGLLAAIAIRTGATVATQNVGDFKAMGCPCANPLERTRKSIAKARKILQTKLPRRPQGRFLFRNDQNLHRPSFQSLAISFKSSSHFLAISSSGASKPRTFGFASNFSMCFGFDQFPLKDHASIAHPLIPIPA